MKAIACMVLCLALTGCANTGTFENRVTCSIAGDRVFVTSLYGAFGITSEVSKQDAQRICAPEPVK